MSRRREYEEQVRARLLELEAEVDDLKQKIQQAEAELAPQHHSKLEDIRALQKKFVAQLEELAEASDESWEHLKDGLEHYWSALGKELKSFEKL